jgi:4-hydroxybenzoyl-CoA reductase subunit beta
MRLPKFEYVEAKTVQEACHALKEAGEKARLMGGGTDLLVSMKQRITTPTAVIGLKKVSEMDAILYDSEKGLRIGAMTTLHKIERSSLVQKNCPMLIQAAGQVASPALRRMGTVGGNLCLDTRCLYYNQSHFWRKSLPVCLKRGGESCHVVRGGNRCYAVYSGDLAPALIAMEAKIMLLDGDQERVIPVEDLFSNDGKSPLTIGPHQILTEVIIPPAHQGDGKFLKYRLRESIDFPLVNVAVFMKKAKNGGCESGRIVVGGIGSAPLRMKQAEEILKGGRLEEGLINRVTEAVLKQVHPVDNTGGSPSLRRRMVPVLVREALHQVQKN